MFYTRTRAQVRALMTQKSCAVGMRNAKLGNHLKFPYSCNEAFKLGRNGQKKYA